MLGLAYKHDLFRIKLLMELFNKSGVGVVSVLLLVGSVIACQSKDDMPPAPAQIEATAYTASLSDETAAERRVREWAEQGLPVAQRELGILYKNRLDRRGDAIALLEKAAHAGDAEAAFQLGEIYRIADGSHKTDLVKAMNWYKLAAENKHPKAASMLALLSKGADDRTQSEIVPASWPNKALRATPLPQVEVGQQAATINRL
jgi:hypothetical protein